MCPRRFGAFARAGRWVQAVFGDLEWTPDVEEEGQDALEVLAARLHKLLQA